MAFDPKKHVIRIQGGREYLPVAARLVWFRSEHPDWGIVTSPFEINMEKLYAIFSCQIFNAEGKLMATATKMENVRGFGDFLEKAETGSVGRALAYCGYGTQFAPELEEEARYADAPYPPAGSPAAQQAVPAPAAPVDPRDPTAAYDATGPLDHNNHCTEPNCTNVLNPSQMAMALPRFGRAVCPRHQKNAQPAPGVTGNGAWANA